MVKLAMPHFIENVKPIQYSACLAITGAIRSTSYEKSNQELGLETFQSRRWFKRLSLSYKIVNNQYLFTCLTIFPVLTKYIIRGIQLMFQR